MNKAYEVISMRNGFTYTHRTLHITYSLVTVSICKHKLQHKTSLTLTVIETSDPGQAWEKRQYQEKHKCTQDDVLHLVGS